MRRCAALQVFAGGEGQSGPYAGRRYTRQVNWRHESDHDLHRGPSAHGMRARPVRRARSAPGDHRARACCPAAGWHSAPIAPRSRRDPGAAATTKRGWRTWRDNRLTGRSRRAGAVAEDTAGDRETIRHGYTWRGFGCGHADPVGWARDGRQPYVARGVSSAGRTVDGTS